MGVRRLAAVAAVICSVMVVGCGGGDSGSPDEAMTTTAPAPAGEATTTPTFSGAGSARFCELTRSYNERFSQLASQLTGNASEAQVAEFVRELAAAITQARDVAPAEIRPDVALLAEAADEFAAALRAAGYDFTKVPPDAGGKLQDPEVQAASERIEAYDRQACGSG